MNQQPIWDPQRGQWAYPQQYPAHQAAQPMRSQGKSTTTPLSNVSSAPGFSNQQQAPPWLQPVRPVQQQPQRVMPMPQMQQVKPPVEKKRKKFILWALFGLVVITTAVFILVAMKYLRA